MMLREKKDGLRYKAAEVELPKGDDYTVKGILASSSIDNSRERITPEALSEWASRAKGTPLHMFREHDRTLTLGQWTDIEVRDVTGTKGDVELYGEGEMYPELSAVRDAKLLIEKGLLGGVSIGFRFGKVKMKSGHAEIGYVDIREASLVAFGANRDAKLLSETFSVKGSNGEIQAQSLEDLLMLTDLDMEERHAVLHAVAGAKSAKSELDTELALWRMLK